jgi:20S proteasome subunit beta 6
MLGITAAPRQGLPDYSSSGGPNERRFSPYDDNGGSTVAIAGDGYAIVASDTRLTDGGYGILSRNQPKLFNLTDHIVLGATGCWADVLTLTKIVGARIQMFKYTHNQMIRTTECGQMLANMLYAKRFFPYSVTNILVRFFRLFKKYDKNVQNSV